jgi:hypothetical protein
MELNKIFYLICALYLIFLVFLVITSTVESDEGTHSLLGVFYLDLFKYALNHRSFEAIYNYAYSYLVYYPKLSVYYPPLTHFIISAFFAIFGKEFFIARIVLVVFCMFFIALVYYFSKFLSNKKTAFLSTLFFMSAPLIVYLSRGVFLDLPVAFFFTLALFFYLIAFKRKDNKFYIFASIANFLGFLTKWYIVLLWPALFLFVIFEKKKVMKKLILSFLLSFILISPYLFLTFKLGIFWLPFTSEKGSILAYVQTSPQFTTVEGLLFYPLTVNQWYFVFPISILLLVALIVFFKNKENYWKLFLLLLLIFYVFFTILPNKNPRFIIPLIAVFAFLLGKFSIVLIERFGRKMIIVIALLLILNIYSSWIEMPFFKTHAYEVANFVLSNPAPVYFASETADNYPSIFMFYLAREGKFIKSIRLCAQGDVNKTLYQSGVKWVLFDKKENERAVYNALIDQKLITLEKSVGDIEIYSYNYYNKYPKENCNYVCLTEEKICTNLTLSD